MIYINPNDVRIPYELQAKARDLTNELRGKDEGDRAEFIQAKRKETWGHPDVVEALRVVVGNKCWYSEVSLDGADPEIDHFRPKGRVVEVDANSLERTGETSSGYWWLAFEPENFRLSCKHSNQRRVDRETEGGKADFFPIEGERAPESTELGLIGETVLPLDPCSASDMKLMWFDPEGRPALRKPDKETTPLDKRRMQATIWLYHLNKQELSRSRARHVEAMRVKLKNADYAYELWNPNSASQNMQQKSRFDSIISEIKADIADTAIFAGAKRCAVRLAVSEYPWLEEYDVVLGISSPITKTAA